MQHATIEDQKELLKFVESARKAFDKDKNVATFTYDGLLENRQLFAVRWGMFGDCIVVFRIGSEPVNFTNVCERV